MWFNRTFESQPGSCNLTFFTGYANIFFTVSPFDPPENIIKPLVFLFLRGSKGHIVKQGLTL